MNDNKTKWIALEKRLERLEAEAFGPELDVSEMAREQLEDAYRAESTLSQRQHRVIGLLMGADDWARANDPSISPEDADLLAEVDFLVEAYAASDEPMTAGAEELAATVRRYVRRWAALCGYTGDAA